jgi:uncharacterized caspase-like protein
LADARPGDTVLFYFGGHAVPDQNLLLPVDARPDKLESTGISLKDLAARLNGPYRVILIIDAVLSVNNIANVPALDNALVIAGNLAMEGPQFGGGHGELTWNVLRGLNGDADANKDGRVTIGELADFMAKQKSSSGGKPPLVRNGLPRDLPLVAIPAPPAKAY